MTVKAAVAGARSVLVIASSAARRLELPAKLRQELKTADISLADSSAAVPQTLGGAVVVLDGDGELPDRVGEVSQHGAGAIVLTDNEDRQWVAQLLSAGARAVLRRDCDERQLAAAVQAAAAGLVALDGDMLPALLRPPLEEIELEPGEEELTPRETEVLRMLAEGLSNREIASILKISEHTVKFHLASIFGKLGASSRTEAATEGIRRGLVLL